MINQIILISGPIASGKSALSHGLKCQFDMDLLSTKATIIEMQEKNEELGRKQLQDAGEKLDRRTRGRWVLEKLNGFLHDKAASAPIVVDSVRTNNQIKTIREAYGAAVKHIHLTAPADVLKVRYDAKHNMAPSYEEVCSNRTERRVGNLADSADIVIDTDRCNEKDVLIRAASHLGIYSKEDRGYVDVIVGGQFGSEGKGQIAHYLGREYDLLVRVGGPNAGHKVFEVPPYTHHHLPSGTRKSDAHLLIGAGAVINVDNLLTEIAECNIEAGRLRIDRNAMVILDEDIEKERCLVETIGSTGQGVGAATARRIMKRKEKTLLAGSVPELRPYMCSGLEVIRDVLRQNGKICLEGTQGTGLSLYHGGYPYVTSRDTTVSGCLAEAGIAPRRVRRIVMVCRTYPIRVANPSDGTSGHMSKEITLEEISKRSGLRLEEMERTERTSTTNRERRIAEFDWDLLHRSSLLNLPTDIALTFVDYLSAENRRAKRFEQLLPDTINFIQEVERVSGARVSLIATGFNPRPIIDRRSW